MTLIKFIGITDKITSNIINVDARRLRKGYSLDYRKHRANRIHLILPGQ